MFSEVNSINLEDWDSYRQSFSKSSSSSSQFHGQILLQNCDLSLIQNITFENPNPTNQKIQKAFSDLPVGAKVGGDVKITVKWGEKDGPSVSGSASGNVSDDHGNQVDVTVEVYSDGSGEASASASRKK